jgi:hypothetical protein
LRSRARRAYSYTDKNTGQRAKWCCPRSGYSYPCNSRGDPSSTERAGNDRRGKPNTRN